MMVFSMMIFSTLTAYPKTRVVSFDIGNTLLQVKEEIIPKILVKEALKDLPKNTDPRKILSTFKKLYSSSTDIQKALKLKYDQEKLITQFPVIINFLSKWAKEINYPQNKVQLLLIRTFQELNKPGSGMLELFDDSISTLERLKNKGYKLIVISNWGKELNEVLEHFHLTKYFDQIIISGEVGIEKPNKEIFNLAYSKIKTQIKDLKKSEILHIGDNKLDDIQGAQNVGFKSLHICREKNKPTCSSEITQLSQIFQDKL